MQEVQKHGNRNKTNNIFQHLLHILTRKPKIFSKATKNNVRKLPLTHHIFSEDRGWVAKASAPHPTIITAEPCSEDHDKLGHPVHDTKPLHAVTDTAVADTGCQSTAIPASFAYKLGYKRKDFIKVVNKMTVANRQV